jgi:hypothetical protein
MSADSTWCPKANLIWVNESESDCRSANLARPHYSTPTVRKGQRLTSAIGTKRRAASA